MKRLLFFMFACLLLKPQLAFCRADIFLQDAPVELFLKADFLKIKLANGDGNWRGEDRDNDPKYWSDAIVSEAGHPQLEARVRARGMSSGLEGQGDFPKLKLEFGATYVKDTIFEGVHSFRINTHTSTNPTRESTDMGRLNDERATYREALAYDLANILEFPVHGHRRAIIHYVDTGRNAEFTRKALLLESDKQAAAAAHARVVSIEEFASQQDTRISETDSARLHLFQALIGNKDFIFRTSLESPRADNPIWGCGNVVVFEHADKTRTLTPYDFDLSTFVAGDKKIAGQWRTYPSFGFNDEVSTFLAWHILSLRSRHSKETVEKVVQLFLSKRKKIDDAVENSLTDAEGKTLAKLHIDRFMTRISSLLQIPVIGEPNIPFYTSATNKERKLRKMPNGEPAFLRPGTPVKILSREKNRTRIAIFDFHWDLDSDESEIGYIETADEKNIVSWVPDQYKSWFDERDIPEPDSRRDGDE